MNTLASAITAGLCLLPGAAGIQLFGNSFGVSGVNASYDYIGEYCQGAVRFALLTGPVIGGGTAGNTIAARLAQNASISVAVIEAGSFYQIDNGNGSVIPALATTQFVGADANDTQPLIDWGFVTTPQAVSKSKFMLLRCLIRMIGSEQQDTSICERKDTRGKLCTQLHGFS